MAGMGCGIGTSGWLSVEFSAEGLARLPPEAPGRMAVMTVLLRGLLPSDAPTVHRLSRDVLTCRATTQGVPRNFPAWAERGSGDCAGIRNRTRREEETP